MAPHLLLARLTGLLIALTLGLVVAAMDADAQSPVSVPSQRIASLDLKDAKVLDAARIISELTGVNIFATREAGEQDVSFFVRDANVEDAIDGLARVSGLWYRYNKKTKAFLIMTAEEYQDDIVIFREDFTRIFTLRHQNVVTTALILEALFGERVELTTETEDDDDILERLGADTFGSTNGGSNLSDSGRRFSSDRRRNVQRDDNGRRNNSNSSQGRNIEILEDTDLSSEQLSNLESASEIGGLPTVSATDLSALVRREPPIFITVNRLHNLLYIRTSDEVAMTEIARIVDESDRPTPNVLLEMKILELTVDDSFRSLFNFIFRNDDGRFLQDAGGNPVFTPDRLLELGNFPLEGGTLFFQFLNDNVSAAVELLETEDRVNVLGTPVVLASNSRPAQIFIGEERVIATGVENTAVTSVQGTTTNFIEVETEVRDIGTTLRIVPRINSDRTVTLLLEQDNSSVNVEATSLATATADGDLVQVPIDTVDTANISGTVVAKDGLTVAIGGLIRNEDRKLEDKVPVLGDIPVLGALFRREIVSEVQTEIVLLITPHVLTTPEEAEQVSRRRIADNSINPELDRYGFAGSRKPEPSKSVGTVEDYLSLTRFAAQSMKGEPTPLSGIVTLPMRDKVGVALMREGESDVVPEKAWRKGDLYITAVRIRNRSPESLALDPRSLRGQWLAATFENKALKPAGQVGDESLGYLLSNEPFFEAAFPERIGRSAIDSGEG